MLWLLAGLFALGLVFGAVFYSGIDEAEKLVLLGRLDTFFQGAGSPAINSDLFFEVVLKYGKYAALLWALAFVRPGAIVSAIVLIYRGFSIGFSASFCIADYGLSGLYNAVLLILLQNAVLVPAFIYIVNSGLGLHQKNRALPGVSEISFREYLLVLVIGSACVVLAAMIEVYLLPELAPFI